MVSKAAAAMAAMSQTQLKEKLKTEIQMGQEFRRYLLLRTCRKQKLKWDKNSEGEDMQKQHWCLL